MPPNDRLFWSSAGVVFFTLISVLGMWFQNKTIREKKSGKSVSTILFIFSLNQSLVSLIYGLHINSWVLMFNGLVYPFVRVPVLLGLIKYKGVTRSEFFSGVLMSLSALAMAITEYKDLFFLGFQLGNIFIALTQPWEIYKNQSSGAVDFRTLITSTMHAFFWVIYGAVISNNIIMLTAILAFITNSFSIYFWFKYKEIPA